MTEVTNENIADSITSYIGAKRLQILKSTPKEQLNLFKKANIIPKGSFLVEGQREVLENFKAYFLSLCSLHRPSFSSHMILEYLDYSSSGNDDPLSKAEYELMFLYCHRERAGIGNTEHWMETQALSKAVSRKIQGLTTVILTERELPIIQKSSEIVYLDFSSSLGRQRIRTDASPVAAQVVVTSAQVAPRSTSLSTEEANKFTQY